MLREQRQPCSVSLQTIYTRLNVSHDSTRSTASRYVTVGTHFHPGFVLQRGSASNLQVGYQILTGRPRLKHNHRQEGIPPSWSADPPLCADRFQVTTDCDRSKKENAFVWRKWVFTCICSRDRMMCDYRLCDGVHRTIDSRERRVSQVEPSFTKEEI